MPLASAAFTAVVTMLLPITHGFFDAAQSLYVGDRFFAGRKARPGNHGRERVEHVVLCFFDHRRGKRPAQRRCDIGAQLGA